jgi:hypothetical protein
MEELFYVYLKDVGDGLKTYRRYGAYSINGDLMPGT